MTPMSPSRYAVILVEPEEMETNRADRPLLFDEGGPGVADRARDAIA